MLEGEQLPKEWTIDPQSEKGQKLLLDMIAWEQEALEQGWEDDPEDAWWEDAWDYF